MKREKKLGIYIHLPFCRSKCAYCDFYSFASGEEEEKERYQQALLSHIALMSPTAEGFQVDTVYFGGGTPTLYGAGRIEALLRRIKQAFRVDRHAEITVEGNPDSIQGKEIQQLRRAGVNRMSLGMQSAVLEELQRVGRIHTPEQTRRAVGILKEKQIAHISLDLIYGLPGQTEDSWRLSLEEVIALEPEHISCYGLKVEEGTALATRVAQGEVLPSEEEQANWYLYGVERLSQAGYQQYEISNFARENCYSRHNWGYWAGKPYMGFGASAASDFGGYRYSMVGSVEEYCHCVLGGGSQIFSSNELMSPGERYQEYLFLGLRTTRGVQKEEYEKLTHLDFAPLQAQFVTFAQSGWAKREGNGRWTFTPEGFLRSNLLLSLLLEAQESSGKALVTYDILGEKTKISQAKGKEEEIVFQEDAWGQFYF